MEEQQKKHRNNFINLLASRSTGKKWNFVVLCYSIQCTFFFQKSRKEALRNVNFGILIIIYARVKSLKCQKCSIFECFFWVSFFTQDLYVDGWFFFGAALDQTADLH